MNRFLVNLFSHYVRTIYFIKTICCNCMQSNLGRSARVERSSRSNQFWDTQFESIYSLSSGLIKTKTDYFNKHGLTSTLDHEVIDATYMRRYCEFPTCGKAEIKLDHRGYAYCPICHTIYNDGRPPIRSKTSEQILEKSAIVGRLRDSALKKMCKC